MIFLLDKDIPAFPSPLDIPEDERDPDSLLAIGGDLSPEWLLAAYSRGIFPWTAYRDIELAPGAIPSLRNEIRWYCPMNRFVIFPSEIHISHSMRNMMNKGDHIVTFDKCFQGVIEGCAVVDGRIDMEGAWLGPRMMEAYTRLHDMGLAHSVEVWKMDSEVQRWTLAGGLYGVWLHDAFFGESMFSFTPSASKLALIHLARRLEEIGGKFIDCQLETPHLRSMGGRFISYQEYMNILQVAL